MTDVVMGLDRVTITGADDSVEVADLVRLSARFPFVEWGVLFSRAHQGTPRYPSQKWLWQLYTDGIYGNAGASRWAAHLCGHWVRDICADGREWFSGYPLLAPRFARIQLNFHGEPHNVLGQVLPMPHAYVLQCDGVNDAQVRAVAGVTFFPLFDTSGGAGALRETWPVAWPGVYCGYAGGLGPDNVVAQLRAIGVASAGQPFWIDMERRVRSDDDARLDLGKVEAVLEACAPLVAAGARA